jgi:DTW domain-containing protein YfiP
MEPHCPKCGYAHRYCLCHKWPLPNTPKPPAQE